MLFLTLVPSGLVLIAALLAARQAPNPCRWGVFIAFSVVVCWLAPLYVGFFPTVSTLLFFFLLASLGVWTQFRDRLRFFLPLAGLAFLAAYAICGIPGYKAYSRFAALRTRYPYESMESRVPEPRPEYRSPQFESFSSEPSYMEELVERDSGRSRAWSLGLVHENTSQLFVNSSGFGVARMRTPSEKGLEPLPREKSPAQPAKRPFRVESPELESRLRGVDVSAGPFSNLHWEAVVDFINASGFGFIKNRQKVAGFLSHGFSKAPSSPPRWTIETVELIGLLLHPEPVVYVSDCLPEMEHLRAAPTRGLDAFEKAGLEKLKKGEDLYAMEVGGKVRMAGSLRNGKQCRNCHGGQYGDLLGAFSYSLDGNSISMR